MGQQASGWDQKWVAVAAFAGVLVSQVLSGPLQPMLAWFIGGAIIGLLPSLLARPRASAARVVWTSALTGMATALAYFISAVWL
jgi:hypothetical protein